MKRRLLTLEQQRQLLIAQENLRTGHWSFQRYHMHLSVYVYPVE